jgi:hypothetical protein
MEANAAVAHAPAVVTPPEADAEAEAEVEAPAEQPAGPALQPAPDDPPAAADGAAQPLPQPPLSRVLTPPASDDMGKREELDSSDLSDLDLDMDKDDDEDIGNVEPDHYWDDGRIPIFKPVSDWSYAAIWPGFSRIARRNVVLSRKNLPQLEVGEDIGYYPRIATCEALLGSDYALRLSAFGAQATWSASAHLQTPWLICDFRRP